MNTDIHMHIIRSFLISSLFTGSVSSYAENHRIIELESERLRAELGSEYFYVTDIKGEEIPSQLTYDGKLIFRIDEESDGDGNNGKLPFSVHSSDTLRRYPPTVYGQVYPKRADDLAWENEKVGFRVYGPATQAKGEKAFGYDIFFKHPTAELILERLYSAQTSELNKAKVDSLKTIDPKLAKRFANSFSYHKDHGLGMDCYAVGPTLGAGAAAVSIGDSIIYPWCYKNVEILDNGPLRFTARLDYTPCEIGGKSGITEHRLISMDSGSYLNRCEVWYEGLAEPVDIVAGFPLRDEHPVYSDEENGILAYADPTQGRSNGKAQLGIVIPKSPCREVRMCGHALLQMRLSPGEHFIYYWGFSWDKAEGNGFGWWKDYLDKFKSNVNQK